MPLGNKPLGTDVRRLRPFMNQALPAGTTDHGGLLGLSDDDHAQYASANGSGSRSAYQAERLNKSAAAGAGLTGGGTLTADISFAVGAGNGVTVNADDVAIKLKTTSGLEVDANGLALADAVAGAGLTIASKVLAVGAGTLITVGADAVGITAGATYQFIGTGSGTAADWRDVSELAGAGLAAALGVLAVGAGTMITVNANDVQVSAGANYQFVGTGSGVAAGWRNVSELAGAGLIATTGVLAVGAGDGIDVAASSVAVDVTDLIGAGLVEEDTNNIALGTPTTITVASVTNSVSGTTHVHAITTSANPGGAAAILASAADGGLQLLRLGIGADGDTDNRVTMANGATIGQTNGPLLTFDDTYNALRLTGAKYGVGVASGAPGANIESRSDTEQLRLTYASDTSKYAAFTVGSTGAIEIDAITNIILDPGGNNVNPGGAYEDDLGAYNAKWRTLYAAELYVETLVAQDVLATIGGRIMVAPTTTLTADITSGATTIYTKHNLFAVNDYVFMMAAPGGIAQLEAMQITGGPTGTGPYSYTVTRAVDGSPANAWAAGDALVNLGYAANEGYIELTSTQTIHSQLGPTITIFSRTAGTNWNSVKPVVSIGNLDSFLGYGETFGLAMGNDLSLSAPTDSSFYGATLDRTNGLQLFNTNLKLYDSSTPKIQLLRGEGLLISNGTWGPTTSTFAAVFADDSTIPGLDAGDVMIGRYFHSTAASQRGILWDDDAGQMFIKGGINIGNGYGFVASGVLLYLPFAGPLPYEIDSQVSVTGHLGQSPSAGAIIGTNGKYGKAGVFGDTTTNLVGNPSFESNTTGWGTSWGDTLARVTSPVRFGSYSLSVTAAGAAGIGAYSDITVTASQVHAVSVWVYVPSTYTWGTVQLRVYDGAGYTTLLGSADVTLRDQWQLVAVNNVTPSGTTLRVVIVDTSTVATGNVLYVDGVQVEQTAYATWYTDTARASAYGLRYPTAGNININAGTITVWAYPSSVSAASGNYLVYHNSSGNRIYLGSSSGYWHSGLGAGTSTSSTAVTPRAWSHIVLTWANGTGKLYVNGVLADTYAYTDLTTLASIFDIGNANSASRYNGLIDDFAILDHALGADEVRQLYDSGSPLVVVQSPFSLMLTGSGLGRVWGHAGGLFGQTADGTKSFALSNESISLSWGGFTLAEGDMVLGDNKSGSAAIFWDKSAGTFGFYGNASATPGVLINTDGSITANAGYIGGASGWAIAAGKLTATNIGLYSGAANTARVQVGTGSTVNTAGVNSANAASDIAFWAGATHENRATAPFRVELDGSMIATDGSIGGWTIDSTTGIKNSAGTAILRSAGNIAFGAAGTGSTKIPPDSTHGTGIYIDSTGLFCLAADVFQVKILASDGKLYAGAGNVIIDSTGINLDVDGTGSEAATHLKFGATLGSPDAEVYLLQSGGGYIFEITSANALCYADINFAGGVYLRNNLEVTGDIYTVAMTNYTTSTLVGWSTTPTPPTAEIYYKRLGKYCFVTFQISGTSNATNVTFTLPYAKSTPTIGGVLAITTDNGSNQTTPGRYAMSGSTVTCYKDCAAGAWTNSGTKAVRGQFFYEVA